MHQTTVHVRNVFTEYQQWLRDRQHALEGVYRLSQCDWALSQDDGVVTYRRDEVITAIATFSMIGSYCADNGTWLWAWANPAIDRAHSIPQAQCAAWASDTGLSEFAQPVFRVTECPELWSDAVPQWELAQASRTTVDRIASMAAYSVGALGVHYYTNPHLHVIGCAVLRHIYLPVRSC
jgi:hypothetical protein